MRVDAIRKALEGHAVRAADEAEFADAVARLLDDAGIPYTREFRLSPRSRIDFISDGVGLELKVDGTPGQLLRQLDRYAQSAWIQHLVLVTTRRMHTHLPAQELRGKPVTVICMGGV